MFSTKGLAGMTLVAVVLFAAVVTLQVMELNHYSALPSIWP